MDVPTICSIARFLTRADVNDFSDVVLLPVLNYCYQIVVGWRLWKWREGQGIVNTFEIYNTGTAAVTKGSKNVTITTGVVSAGWVGKWFKSSLNWYKVASIDAETNKVVLDTEYTETTNATATYEIFCDEYDYPTGADKINCITQKVSPFKLDYIPFHQLQEISPRRTEKYNAYQYTEWAKKIILVQIPSASIQLDIYFWKIIDDLTLTGTPVFSQQYHPILAEMLIAMIKQRNDDRSYPENMKTATGILGQMIEDDKKNMDYIAYLKSHNLMEQDLGSFIHALKINPNWPL